jgi:hypothetical protein
MAKLKVIKKTEEVEMPSMEDKKPGVKQKVYNTSGNLLSTTNIDTSGYAAGAKKFPKVTILEAKGKMKEGMVKRKEVDRAIKNPISLAMDMQGLSANDRKNIKNKIIESNKEE